MTSLRVTLHQCGQGRYLQGLPPGQYFVNYTDSTHLQPTDWIQLASIDVSPAVIPVEDSDTEQYYTFTKAIGNIPGGAAKDEKKSKSTEPDRQIRIVEDTLALALGRVGLLAPEVSSDLLDQLRKLDDQEGIVIVPDTNALYNGAIHWLLRVLHRHSIWLMPVVASMTTIQTRDATVKGLVNKFNINCLGQALRSRGLVNGALGLLERNRGRCQVVEIEPSLLRYQKMASTSGADPDQGDVLEDRLIIEAIHGVLRSMRSRTPRRVVTSDVNVARVLAAEGIDVLFIPSIKFNEKPIDCLRFDALARGFVGAPLRAVAWELAHAFGSIQLLHKGKRFATLECYWPGKTPAEWASETLLCSFEPRETYASDLDGGPGEAISKTGSDQQSVESLSKEPRNNSATADGAASLTDRLQKNSRKPRATKEETKAVAPSYKVKRAVPITSPIPRASLPQMLRLLGLARQRPISSAEEIVAGMQGTLISVDTARRPLEILRRIGLLDQVGDTFRPTPDADLVDTALRNSDLDSISSIFMRFDPYRLFLDALRARGRVIREEVVPLIFDLIGPAGAIESERLPRFHILLGQAWTFENSILDGSQRPTDRDATDAFDKAFREVSSVGIARVLNLLPRFCELTHTSPWAAKRQIERFVAARALPKYSFQPAAGSKPITRDETVTGTLDNVATEQVVIDRLYLGERPVFTIEGPSQ